MTAKTVYKHWIVHLRAIVEQKSLNHDLPADDWKQMEQMGLVEGRNITPLGEKVVQTADAMEDLKSQGLKLSW